MTDDAEKDKERRDAEKDARQHQLAKWGLIVSVVTALIGAVTTIAVALIDDDDPEVAIVAEPDAGSASGGGETLVPTSGPTLSRIFNRTLDWGVAPDALARREFAVGPRGSGCTCTSGRSYEVRPITGSMGILNSESGTATFYTGRGLIELVITLDGSLDEARGALQRAFELGADAFESRSTVVGEARIRVATNTQGVNVVRIWNQAEWTTFSTDCDTATPCPP